MGYFMIWKIPSNFLCCKLNTRSYARNKSYARQEQKVLAMLWKSVRKWVGGDGSDQNRSV